MCEHFTGQDRRLTGIDDEVLQRDGGRALGQAQAAALMGQPALDVGVDLTGLVDGDMTAGDRDLATPPVMRVGGRR